MALMRFPGLIDAHVHLRDPGAIHKEDFVSGSRAAVGGGFTFIMDMPNNPLPTTSINRLKEKIKLSIKSKCEVGFHYGTDGDNLDTYTVISKNNHVYGLKVYCNHTTGNLLIDNEKRLEEIISKWESEKPILVHAEKKQLDIAIELARKYYRKLHVCHISQKSEVLQVRKAKKEKLKISAGVTPHHLFLTSRDIKKLGSFALVKPMLDPEKNQEYLWEGLLDGTIDLIETDHAPHTKKEKEGNHPPFGIPGLETALGLMLKAVAEKKISLNQITRLLHDNPQKIFNIPKQGNTYIELDSDKPYLVESSKLYSKCGWSPFDNWTLYGKVRKVVIHGRIILENGKFLN